MPICLGGIYYRSDADGTEFGFECRDDKLRGVFRRPPFCLLSDDG